MQQLAFFIWIYLLGLAFPILAQTDDASHHFGLRAGWTESHLYDEHASPLLYQSDMVNVSGLYQHRGDAFFELSLTLKLGTNQSRRFRQRTATLDDRPDINGQIETYEIKANPFLSMLDGQLGLRMLWPIGGYHHLGASINSRYILTGMGADTWQYAQLDVAPEYQFTYPVLGGDVEASFSLPLLAGVVRPNYAFDPSLPDETNYFKGYLRTGTAVTSPHQLINPRARIGYLWHFNNGKSLGASYFASWMSYPDPRPVRMFENGVEATYFF